MTFSPVKAGAVMIRTRILVHEPEHLGFAAIGAVRNAVEAQRARGRSAALVERGDEAPLSQTFAPSSCHWP